MIVVKERRKWLGGLVSCKRMILKQYISVISYSGKERRKGAS